MRALAVTALVVSAFLFAGAAGTHAQGPAPARLRAGDGVRVEINGEPTLSGEFVIGHDGRVLLPLVGSVPVADRPFPDVEQDLVTAYNRELLKPTIRVTPLVRVSVQGEVRQPGLFMIDPTFTVSDVLARAGGLTASANPKKIVIRRASGVVVAEFKVDSPPLDMRLSSGDQIVVDKRSRSSEYMGILLGTVGSIGVALVTSALISR